MKVISATIFWMAAASLAMIGTLFCTPVLAKDQKAPDKWGVAMGVRSATIPFKTEADRVYDILPLFYYDHGRVFIDGGTAGFRFYDSNKWQLSAIARYRLFDIPADYQNEVREDGIDAGGQLKYRITPFCDFDFEFMSEEHGLVHSNLVATLTYETGRWDFKPHFRLRWKSGGFNNRYYGLDLESPGAAIDYRIGLDVRFHAVSNLYLICQADLTLLDDQTRRLDIVDEATQGSVFLGFGFFNEDRKAPTVYLKSKPYVRLAHGWATPSSLGDIITLNTRGDEYNNQLSSVFLGIPLSDTLFTLPIQVYLTPGFVYHYESDVQNDADEYVLAVKFYHTFNWPTPWRIGFAEGLSYITQVTYIEGYYLERAGYRPSQLLNYLDISLDVSLGKMLRVKWLEELWMGWSLHHRSGIFSTSSAFGRIRGGSNYNTVYLQYHW